MTTEPDGVDIDAVHHRHKALSPARGIVLTIPAVLLVWAVIALCAVAYKLLF